MSEATALAFEEREYTLPQLDALVGGMATTLERRGVRAGDRVALMSSNRPEFVVALRAIWRLGASAVLLSPAWKRTEVANALAVTRPTQAVGDHPVLAELMPTLWLDDTITSEQRTFAAMAWAQKGKVTRRERFLAEMDAVIPWARLVAVIEPH